MSTMRTRLLTLGVVFLLILGALPGINAQEPVTIRWYVGLGTGGNAEQIDAQNKIVENFNASHPNIKLELEIVDNAIAYDTLKTKMSAGDAPDIVGQSAFAARMNSAAYGSTCNPWLMKQATICPSTLNRWLTFTVLKAKGW